jgi:hypothetical protein
MTDTNLVHELQVVADYLRYKYRYTFADACVKAADEIERLRAESHVMKTALTEIRDTGTGECAATIALKALFEAAKAAKEK